MQNNWFFEYSNRMTIKDFHWPEGMMKGYGTFAMVLYPMAKDSDGLIKVMCKMKADKAPTPNSDIVKKYYSKVYDTIKKDKSEDLKQLVSKMWEIEDEVDDRRNTTQKLSLSNKYYNKEEIKDLAHLHRKEIIFNHGSVKYTNKIIMPNTSNCHFNIYEIYNKLQLVEVGINNHIYLSGPNSNMPQDTLSVCPVIKGTKMQRIQLQKVQVIRSNTKLEADNIAISKVTNATNVTLKANNFMNMDNIDLGLGQNCTMECPVIIIDNNVKLLGARLIGKKISFEGYILANRIIKEIAGVHTIQTNIEGAGMSSIGESYIYIQTLRLDRDNLYLPNEKRKTKINIVVNQVICPQGVDKFSLERGTNVNFYYNRKKHTEDWVYVEKEFYQDSFDLNNDKVILNINKGKNK